MTFKRLIAGSLLGAMVIGLLPNGGYAQRRGEVVEEILRGFIEVQIEKDRRKAVERQQLHDRQRHLPPPVRPNTTAGASIEVRRYRAKLGQISQQSQALTLTMQKSAVRVRGIQPLMNDALTIKTRARLMYEKSTQVNDISLLREEYCELDCEWRELAFQLQQLRGLDATTLAHTRQLTAYSDDMCDLLELEPQFDREAVFRLAVETCAHLESLVEDIEFELYDVPGSPMLVRECRGLTEQSRRVGSLVNRATYDELITKYSTFVSDWRTFAAKLYPHHNVQCDRSIRRIHSCNQQVFEQLWTPLAIDRQYLRYVSHAMADEVNRLFENMTVKTLVQMPGAKQQSILQTARALYGHCEHYCECVDGDRPMNELLTDYIAIDR